MSLDVRSKVLLVLFANMAFLFRVKGWLELALVGGIAFIIYLVGRRKMALHFLVIFALFWLIDAALLHLPAGQSFHVLTTFAAAGRFMLPSIMAGALLLVSSTAYELVHGLRKWRLPESLLLTLAVMMRFLPAIKADANTINRSLRLRGIFLRKRDILLQPLRYFEYLIIPLLMSLLRTVQDLTIASLTKGLALGRKSTETFASRFRLADWSVCAWMLGMMCWMISR
ncbi:energy-coupling factor transporter transmembrane component T [Streptococcus panodentis]|uniref:Energy-coupling factor transporter transmembrane protein EcfT n=1 Tax=Streptococcus panodentis TaxID=1581472 RepID=A0ABS5AXV2_9STRE|nr:MULTISPECIES: energy-coupling factor transporter transmembrane component T [Streptococcus]KXT84810.1 Transmembrane component of energizing module of putative ECF transporter [Streptococcus sp. DD11]MBP2621412.1 energy-coupling factor transporter transmembrane protein EcfT [Streptococcus panodentis]